MKTTTGILILSLWLSDGSAQEQSLTLDSCIRHALTHRLEITISENSGKDITRTAKDIRWEHLPDLNASYAHNMNWGRSLNMEKYQWENSRNQYGNMTLSSSLTLFAGMRLRNQIRAAKINTMRNETVHQKLKNEIQFEVVQAFYEALAAEARFRLTEEFYEADRKQEIKMRLLDTARRISAPDLLEMEGRTRKTLIEKTNAEKSCQLALLKLRKSMNYRDTVLRPMSPGIPPDIRIPDPERLFLCALRTLPEIYMQQYDSLLLRNQLRQLKGNFSPVLSLSGMLYTRYQNGLDNLAGGNNYPLWEQLKDNNYKQAGITLSIPLFNHNTVRRRMREVRTEILNQSLTKNKLLADIRDEVEQLCLEARARKSNYETLKEQEQNYGEIFHLREIQYDRGKLSVYDLLTAETNWRNVQADLLVERFNLQCYLEMIDFYISGGRY